MDLKDSQTLNNLKDAFAGESQANRRYLYFAAKADVEGENDVVPLPKLARDPLQPGRRRQSAEQHEAEKGRPQRHSQGVSYGVGVQRINAAFRLFYRPFCPRQRG